MKFRSGLLVGLGAGYVLGTKAGRERYQQIVEATRAFLDNPGVQRLTEQVGSSLADQANKAKGLVAGESKPAGPKPGDESKAAKPAASPAKTSAKDSGAEPTPAESPSPTATRGARPS